MKNGKKLLAALLAISTLFMVGCGKTSSGTADSTDAESTGSTEEADASGEESLIPVDSLTISFVPSRDPDEIVTLTEPLKELLTKELEKQGYEVGNVDITVGTTYEAVGEGLDAGSVDIGFGMPGGTYVLYDDACDVILTSIPRRTE